MSRPPWPLTILLGLFLLAVVLLVASSLTRPAVPGFEPTTEAPAAPPDRGVREGTYTVDARSGDHWVFFDFSRASVVDGGGGDGWDLAFRRFHIVVNGGEVLPGDGGVRALGDIPLDSLGTLPDSGYLGTEGTLGGEPRTPGLEGWYRYGFLTHLLRPRPVTWAVRTADGRYAALRILSYYCPEATPGCLTFRYRYRGDGGRNLGGPRPAEPARGFDPDRDAASEEASYVPASPALLRIRASSAVVETPSSSGSRWTRPPAASTRPAPATSSRR